MIEKDFISFLQANGKSLIQSYANHRRLFQKLKNEYFRKKNFDFNAEYNEKLMRHQFRSWFSTEFNQFRLKNVWVCPGGLGNAQ